MLETHSAQQPRAQFLFSAARYDEIPVRRQREFCLLGRSNVGKSSFVNHVFGEKRLARVSKTPGKTILANFFSVSDGSVWVDLPGYGHAVRARAEQRRWSVLIADYCENRENLQGVIWLCDIRHPGLEIDKEAFAWCASLGLPLFAVLTKADKLTQREQAEQGRKFAALFRMDVAPVLFSNAGEMSRRVFWDRFRAWEKSLS
jgi:GTP-binding protein